MLAAGVMITGCKDQITPPTSAKGPSASSKDAVAASGEPDSNWIATPAGWYHRSCIHEVPDNSHIDPHGLVHKPDGTSMTFPPCQFPHGKARGVNGVPIAITPPTVDGWVTSRQVNASGTTYRGISAYWHVPSSPSAGYSGSQVYYAFPGLQDDTTIVQPVLAYHYDPDGTTPNWIVAAWDCGPSCYHSPLLGVSVGDSIHGQITASSCSGGSCNWNIIVYDVTQGSTWTQLNLTGAADDFTNAVSGAIEAHGPTSCLQFPADPIKMTGITLTDQSGTGTTVTLENNALQAFISGDQTVNTGNNCTYNANGFGGYPGYTFSWSADGTIVSGQNAASMTVVFNSDGSHLVSVTATDSQGQHYTQGLTVTSQTSDPPQLSCAVM
jgi:hypothetical protein